MLFVIEGVSAAGSLDVTNPTTVRLSVVEGLCRGEKHTSLQRGFYNGYVSIVRDMKYGEILQHL